MIRETFPAMGTTVDVVAASVDGLEATRQFVADAEIRFSRFLPDSELQDINRSGANEIEVSVEMAEVLHLAAGLRKRTGGLFDPAVGGLVKDWGYDRTFSEVVDRPSLPATSRFEPASWDIAGRVLRRAPGAQLDLGGLVKGWTADRVVETGLAQIISIGGDVRSSDPTAQVAVENPWDGSPTTIVLGRGGLATSSVARRRWRVGSHEVHHLIDPRSAAPVSSPVVSATVWCTTATDAEAAAKAVLILGDEGLSWADQQPWIGAALTAWHDGSVFATTGWEVAA